MLFINIKPQNSTSFSCEAIMCVQEHEQMKNAVVLLSEESSVALVCILTLLVPSLSYFMIV